MPDILQKLTEGGSSMTAAAVLFLGIIAAVSIALGLWLRDQVGDGGDSKRDRDEG